jgi:DeoR/GlpR family transcriptional regulator of sugar metabolism
MINSAHTIYLPADSGKLEKIFFASLKSQKKINYLFTGDKIETPHIKSLNDLGIEVVLC